MINVETYLRIDGRFINIKKYDKPLTDSEYIAGSLHLNINGQQIIDRNLWDYIDQLWGYIVDALEEIAEDKSFEFYFPDQPIKLTFEMLNPTIIRIHNDFHNGVEARIDKYELLECLTEAGIVFFKSMKERVSIHIKIWCDYENRLIMIKNKLI